MSSITKDKRIWVASCEQLQPGSYKKLNVFYKDLPKSIIILNYKGTYLAYLNQCVHMIRPLDYEQNHIFDQTGHYLRCAFHGIVYDPYTGESVSTMCNGEKLTSIRLYQDGRELWLNDKRVKSSL